MSGSKIWYCPNCGYEVEHRGRCHRCKARLALSPLVPLAGLDEDDEVGYRLGTWSPLARGRLIVALIRANVEHRFDEEDLVVAAEDEDKVDDLLVELQGVLAAEGIDIEADYGGSEEEAGKEAGEEGAEAGSETEEEAGGEAAQDGAEAEVQGHEEAPDTASSASARGKAGDAAAGPGAGDTDDLDPIQASVALLYDAATRLRTDPTDMQADGDVAEASAGVFADEDVIGVDADTWAAIGRVTRRLLGALGADEALEDEIRTQASVLVKLLQPFVEPDTGSYEAGGLTTAELLAESTAAVPEGRLDRGSAPAGSTGEEGAAASAGQGGHGQEGGGGQGGGEGQPAVSGLTGEDGEGVAGGDEAAAGGGGEIVYELSDWLPEQRANLSVRLEQEGIAHTWDGEDLVIAATAEDAVDAIFDRIEGQEPAADGEERYRAIEGLFASADRLAGDPASKARRDELLRACSATDGPVPLGMPDALWWQIKALTRSLADGLDGDDPDDSQIREDAAALRELLRSVV